jgi:predicted permease
MQVDSIATFAISPARNGYDRGHNARLYQQLETELAALPGVQSVTTSMVPLLMDNDWGTNVSVEGYRSLDPNDPGALYNAVGAGFLRTMQIPLLAGRDFVAADRDGAPRVAIVNRRFADQFGLGMQAVGKHMALGQTEKLDIEIIGIVEDARYQSVKLAPPPQFLLPREQSDTIDSMTFYVRAALPPERLTESLTATVRRLDPDLPVESLSTLPQQIRDNLVMERFVGLLSAAFATLATLLAAGGVYGMLSYNVAQRTREVGLRLALGAPPAQIRRALVAQVGRLYVVGGLIGLALAVALGHLAKSLLFELESHDAGVLIGATLLLAAVSWFAAWWPASRAARIDPLVALRWE